MNRKTFREECTKRDDQTCVIPWCNKKVYPSENKQGDIHHIIERKLWENGGYLKDNGASVCNKHHRYAEENYIPPQAFWKWIQIENPPLPDSINNININKWGENFKTPSWWQHRDYIKYPSTRHLPWSHPSDQDDTSHTTVDYFLEVPLIATIKMDGGNAMLVKDTDNPVRARNGKRADKKHFDLLKQMYWNKNLYNKIPENLQIFGEWLYSKHSIHYGCDCDEKCEDTGPSLESYFQIFGIYDTKYHLWLSWDKTLEIAKSLNLNVVPPASDKYNVGQFKTVNEFYDYFVKLSEKTVEKGHEGIVIRSRFPIHYGQLDKRLGKYVRKNHIKNKQNWSKQEIVNNTK